MSRALLFFRFLRFLEKGGIAMLGCGARYQRRPSGVLRMESEKSCDDNKKDRSNKNGIGVE